ncbi:MAG: hypothetical protein LBL67_05270 [Coriobacteriales bacterium]|jgi:hypothetical protein|nr:hypothetical protein [Coriobacteriales bacterium]
MMKVGTKDALLVKSARILLCGILVALLVNSGFGGARRAWAWDNGGSWNCGWYDKHATMPTSTEDWQNYTLNVLNAHGEFSDNGTPGSGTGTHDLILEQAIASALRGGADVSWIDASTARLATGTPDYTSNLNKSPAEHFYRGTRGYKCVYCQTPKAVGQLYNETKQALAKHQYKTASKKLGWLAHYLGDMSQPLHVATYSQMYPLERLGAKRLHNIHYQLESDLGYYMEHTVCCLPSAWPKDVRKIEKYLPALQKVDDRDTPQQIRAIWFGGGVHKAHSLSRSALQTTVKVASLTRNRFAKKLIGYWTKYAKKAPGKGFKAGKTKTWGKATAYLVKTAPAMLKNSANYLGDLIYTLCEDKDSSKGQDQVSSFKVKVKKHYSKKSCTLSENIKVKLSDQRSDKALPVRLRWYKGKKCLHSCIRYTDGRGRIKTSYTFKRSRKVGAVSLSISTPTGSRYQTPAIGRSHHNRIAQLKKG